MNPGSGNNRRRSSSDRKSGGSSKGSKRFKGGRKFRGPKSPRASKPVSKGQSRPATTQSFGATPSPSRRSIRLPEIKRKPAAFKTFLLGFCGVFAMILLGGGHNAVALGFSLLLPGMFLVFSPPKKGLGKRADLAAAAFLGALLFAFIPQFYWPTQDWRTTAQEAFSMDLPQSLSVQPLISFEAFLMACAGFAWLYAALQWRVNSNGRIWLFLWLSLILSAFAGVVVWGNLVGARYPGAEGAAAFSFFQNWNQTVNFLALGGVATFAYSMEAVRTRKLIPLVGVAASLLCLIGLVLGVARVGVLIYFLGIFCWFICNLRSRSIPRLFKIALPLGIVAISLAVCSNQRAVRQVMEFASPDVEIGNEFLVKLYADAVDMVLDAPITGFGVGTFSAVFPQYRDASANHYQVLHPESDLLWLASEGGLLAVALFGFFLFAYLARSRGNREPYRVLSLITLAMFLVHSLVDVPGHHPGTVYFAILFAALAIPPEKREASLLKPLYWRAIGGILVAAGMAWMVSDASRITLHSSARLENYQEEIRSHIEVGDYVTAKEHTDDWLSLTPMEWRAYFQRAQFTLSESGNRTEAEADFRRARFVEPVLGAFSYEEGVTWLRIDAGRAISAWRETLFREVESMERTFGSMLNLVRSSPELLERVGRLSEVDPYFRTQFLCFLSLDPFMQELETDLTADPALSRFTIQQRTNIVSNWVRRGDEKSAEKFLEKHGESLEEAWWLWSLLFKGKADFKNAVQYIRSNIEAPKVPELEIDNASFTRLAREYALAPKDIYKGTELLYMYVERGEYRLAIPVIVGMLESLNPPLFLYYWKAECFYQIDEYIESWYSFETYLNQLREKE